jgi:hypothetical protein
MTLIKNKSEGIIAEIIDQCAYADQSDRYMDYQVLVVLKTQLFFC